LSWSGRPPDVGSEYYFFEELQVRLVIDLQACQSPGSRVRGIGRYSLALAQAMVRSAGKHECVIALNGAIADSVEPLRAAFTDLLPSDQVRSWASLSKIAEAFYGGKRRSVVAGELFRQAMREFQPDCSRASTVMSSTSSAHAPKARPPR
jgi:hypothetical protein